MKKKVKVFGKEIKRAVRRSLMENVMEQWEMGDTSPRNPDYRQTPREKGIEGMFGKYGGEVPSSVLRYMRKNPESVIKQLYDIYGNDIYKWLPQQSSLGGDWEFEEESEVVSEEETQNITNYDLTDEKDIKSLNDKLDSGMDSKKLDVGGSKAQVTNEAMKILEKYRVKKNIRGIPRK